MAYNREWDRGKDSWNDNSWGGEVRGNARGRDDEYFGEGKRRKFNNGVRVLIVSLIPLNKPSFQVSWRIPGV